MQVFNVKPFIERAFRESKDKQYLREMVKNSMEANATWIMVGIEWQAVKQLNTYRLIVSDNGNGMTRNEMMEYMTSLFEGAKPIGGEHENFGIGARTSLLAWNKAGVIIVSYARNPETGKIEGSMIHLCYDSENQTYGTRLFDLEDEDGNSVQDNIVDPDDYGEYNGIHYSQVIKKALGTHFTGTGTAVICLGNTGTEDTVTSLASQHVPGIKWQAAIEKHSNTWMLNKLNRRLFRIPQNVTIQLETLAFADKAKWPKDRKERDPSITNEDGSLPRLLEIKTIYGTEHYLNRPGLIEKNNPVQRGELTLQDGTKVSWHLRKHPIKGSENSFGYGFIGICYRDELYVTYSGSNGASKYRSFGIVGSEVQRKLSIVLEPPLWEPNKPGIYPDSTRRHVLYRDAMGTLYNDLPWDAWAHEFRNNMPEEISTEIDKALDTLVHGSNWNEAELASYKNRWSGKDSSDSAPSICVVLPTAPIVDPENENTESTETEKIHVEFYSTKGEHSNNSGNNNPNHDTNTNADTNQTPEGTTTKVDNDIHASSTRKRRRAIQSPPIVNKEEIFWGEFGAEELEDLAQYSHCAAYLYPDGKLIFNSSFREFKLHLAWADDYVKRNATAIPEEEREKVAKDLLHAAYERSLYAKLCHTNALRKIKGWTQKGIQELCSPLVLTLMVGGLVEIDEIIKTAVKKLRTAKKRTEAA